MPTTALGLYANIREIPTGSAMGIGGAVAGAAGDFTIAGITTDDKILLAYDDDAAGGVTDLTSEFSITAANTVNNTGGTAVSNALYVVWAKG